MVFLGFMDASKAIRYYDAKTRSIKISRNVAFNENEEPRELEIVEVPGMRVEGEIREKSPQQPIIPQKPAAELILNLSNYGKHNLLTIQKLTTQVHDYLLDAHRFRKQLNKTIRQI